MNQQQYDAAIEARRVIYSRRADEASTLERLEAVVFVGDVVKFMEEHPFIDTITISGSDEYNDEGGTNFWISTPCITFSDSAPPSAAESEDDLADELRDQIDIDGELFKYELYDGVTFRRSDINQTDDLEALARKLSLIK